ncbi:hypothetical protein QAD02_023588 [Eretmocerus hayati]|uniref:Uncharacterized protein n=1 Tax=Eretmocerus hayati TaxID=131215 RepID=A0ACC2PWY7_9HYME|nr:hypothetical protein QAD02_023588 [Eretmocerus hayati]
MSASVDNSVKNKRERNRKYRAKVKAKLKSSTISNIKRPVISPMDMMEESQEAAPVMNGMDGNQQLDLNRLVLEGARLSLGCESDSSYSDEEVDETEPSYCESGTESEPFNQDVFKQKIRLWASKGITQSKVSELLGILQPVHKFLPRTAKTLLKTDFGLNKLIKRFNDNDPSNLSEYAYFDYRPFTISAYCGRGKPDPIDKYMDELILELDHLCEHGIIIDGVSFMVQIKCIICDRPARAIFKCIVNHGAYYACERCLVPGYDYMNRIVYPFRNDEKRTSESFKNRENPLHHHGKSPLEKLKKPLNLVLLFILDIMHLNYQGNMKKLLKTWFSSDSKVTREKLLRVSLRLVNLKNQIPSEFQRSTRSVEDVSKYTANEFREILLYTGPFVLKDILDEKEYKHFLLFHTGSRILCSSELYKKYTPCAKEYLQRFTVLTESLYGLEFASLTNHSLAHLTDDVENMDCPASFLTAFPYENDLGELKRSIRSGNRPIAQICTKIERDLEFNLKKATVTTELQILKSKQVDNLLHIQKIKFKNYQFSVKRPDNMILFKDGSIVEIKSMLSSSVTTDPSKVFILGEQIKILEPAFNYPTCSSLLREYCVERGESGDLVKFSLADMQCKYCLFEIFELPRDGKKLYAVPLLH